MQNAKDTFYMALRDRLAAVNPARTMVLRGVTRPGSLVEENELVSAVQPVDAFCLRWTGLRVNSRATLALVSMQCEVQYCTDGSAGNGGMDRGRLLAGMDAELVAAVNAAPQNVLKSAFVAGDPNGTAMGTNVFWGDVVFGAVAVENERLARVATVDVFAYQEAGEL
jgi:hypothetical protein